MLHIRKKDIEMCVSTYQDLLKKKKKTFTGVSKVMKKQNDFINIHISIKYSTLINGVKHWNHMVIIQKLNKKILNLDKCTALEHFSCGR